MWTALDKQMALSDTAQKPDGSSLSKILTPGQISSNGEFRLKSLDPYLCLLLRKRTDILTLYLPVTENYKISDRFCGYADSLSADNNHGIGRTDRIVL